MPTKIKILIAEHDPVDLELLQQELKKGRINYVSEIVENELDFTNALKIFIPDIILCDYSFPSFNGLTAFKIREAIAPDTPFIIVSGTIGEENSIELFKNGITDFVIKDKMFTLNTKVARALKEAKERKQKTETEKELIESETHLAEAQSLAKMGSWDYDPETDKLTWSKELYNVFGKDKKSPVEAYSSFIMLVDEEDRPIVKKNSRNTQITGEPFTLEYGITTPFGEKRIIREQGHGKKDKTGKITRLFGTAQDITATRKSEAAIKKVYDEKNAILESIEDGFFAIDKNSLVTYWNERAEILLHAKREDVIGKNLHDMFATEASKIFQDNYKKAVSEKTTVYFEGFSERTNKWFAVSAFGSENGLSVYFKDVTGRKNSEDKIKESELRYRSIIEQANDAICIADASMKILDINPYGCQMLGYSKAEFLQLTINDLFLPEDLKANPFKIEELKSGKVIRNERRFKSKDGTLIHVEMSGRILEDGRFIVFGHDIAERKQADDKIRESELRYRSLNEQATDAICITDASMRFIDINPYGCEIFGYTREEALQLSLPDILFTEDLTDNPLKVAELGLGKTVRNERRLKRKDGTAIDMEVSTRIMEDGRMIMFGHDITERKKAEEKLRKANRLYTFISQVNQNIVHIKDEESLFRNACQVAFEFGKFKIAWIGIFDKTAKKIRLADQNGIPDEDIPLFTELPCETNGPQDQVLQTGIYLCNDPEQCPELQAWYPFAAKHGIRSAIILPIKKSGHIIGTLNLYAGELNFFDKEEIALLVDVAEDISFALDLFEKTKRQKETEELIVKTEMRFQALIEKSTDMETLSTEKGKMVYGSPAVMKVLGYTAEEFSNLSAFNLIHPDDIADFKEKRQEIMQTPGKSFHNQNRFLHKNGNWIWCEGIVTNMLQEPGVHAMVSNFRDISEKKIVEEHREFDRINLNALINNTRDLMWSLDRAYKLITFNQPFFDVIKRYTGKELIKGGDVFDVALSPEQVDRFRESYTRAFSGETFTEIEHIAAPFESWSEISYYPICKGKEVIGTACHSRDITERKRAEQEMTWLINNTEESFILLNRNLNIISFNSQFYRLYLKYLAITIVKGDSILKYAQSERLDIVKGIYKRVLDGAEETGEINIKLPGNEVKNFAIKYKPAKDEQGQIIGVFVSAVDVTEKKESEQQLIIQEKRYRSLVENGADGVVIISPEGKLSYASPTVEKILGYTDEEALKLDMFSIVHPDDIEALAKVWEKMLISPGLAIPGHTGRMLHKNGSWRWLEATVTNMLHDPALNGIVDNFRDVTEQKELENLLNKTNSLARIGSWAVDLIKDTLYWSDITREIHEVDDDYIPNLKEAINFYKAGESRELITQKVKDAIEKGSSWDVELQIITVKGNEKWVRSIGETEFLHGKAVSISGSFQDIDIRKRAELGVKEVLEEKNSILESIDDAFFAVDKNWTVTYWNNQAEKVLRKTKNEMLDHNLWEVFSDSLDSESYTKYHQAIETKQSVHFEDYYPALAKWYEISAYPSGNGLSVYFKDVSERKLYEMQLSELNESLHKQAKALTVSNADLEQFAYVASHDLQEPLRMVTSFLTQLQKKYGAVIDDKGKQYIEFAVDGAKRMRQIILDLLEFSRVGRTEDKQEDIDLNELVEEIQILFRKQIQEKKATIISDQLPHVPGYRSPMRQVFQNLISNALKYTVKDQAVEINITCTELPDHWQFAVSDNGIGIEQEYFDKIFIIFQRLHNKDEFSGTGMGLAITKKIIENLGGKIWVESEEGKGSTFYFTLLKQK